MIAGILVFVIFIGTTLSMASASFPTLAPQGSTPVTAVPAVSVYPVYRPNNCTTILGTDWGCTVANFLGNSANTLVTAGNMLLSIGGMFVALLTFQIPALNSSPEGQLLNFLIIVPIFTVLSLAFFRLGKSLIPTVGGDAD